MPGLLAPQCDLQTLVCGTCGVLHAIPQAMHEALQREGGYWTCPNGHSRGYGKGTIAAERDRLRKELAAETERKSAALARANTAERQRDKLQRAAKLAARRASAGVCPCCQRTFVQLARHMKCKHPEHGA